MAATGPSGSGAVGGTGSRFHATHPRRAESSTWHVGEGEGALAPRAYLRRDPASGALYEVLATHLETFLAWGGNDSVRPGLPGYVVRELRAYMRCGILAHGFARFHCFTCSTDALVAFDRKGRGFCPSCGGRRMAESAAHLVDHVFPRVPVRQWVISFPWSVRYLLARRPGLCRSVRRIFLRAVFGSYRDRTAAEGIADGRSGGVNRIQRVGSALNLNVHFHALVLDGVYTARSPFARPVFHEATELEDAEVEALAPLIAQSHAESCKIDASQTLR